MDAHTMYAAGVRMTGRGMTTLAPLGSYLRRTRAAGISRKAALRALRRFWRTMPYWRTRRDVVGAISATLSRAHRNAHPGA